MELTIITVQENAHKIINDSKADRIEKRKAVEKLAKANDLLNMGYDFDDEFEPSWKEYTRRISG